MREVAQYVVGASVATLAIMLGYAVRGFARWMRAWRRRIGH